MAEAGVNILISASEMAVVGLTEVATRLYAITRAYLTLRSLLKKHPPDLLILIDYPEFNIHLARTARRFGVPVLYYISPQVWAWRRRRTKKIARRVNRMAVILPFEKAFYARAGMDVEYVGHPLLDSVPLKVDKDKAITELGLKGGGPVVGLLPGSRKEEIINLLDPMVKTVEILSAHYPRLKCVLPMGPMIAQDLVQIAQRIISASHLEIRIVRGDIYRALAVCDLAFVASGTATLETAILEVPMIIVYRVSPITYWVGKRVIDVPYIGLVNLVADEAVVPELIQNEVTPTRLAAEALAILESGQRKEEMVRKLRKVRERLGSGGASERTAGIAVDMMSR